MKTNVTIKSEDRNLYGVIIQQETNTGFLNVSDLSSAYEIEQSKKGWNYREPKDILKLESNAERIYYILQKQGYLIGTEYDSIKGNIFTFMKHAKDQGIVKILKKLKAYKTTGRGGNKTVFTDKYIWMLIAMELHPEIYATTVCWLADKLILSRIEAGNLYLGLTKAITKLSGEINYIELAQSLNLCIFNKHKTGIRNTATQCQLQELEDLEKYLTTLINMEHITTFDQLIQEIKKMHSKKWHTTKKISA